MTTRTRIALLGAALAAFLLPVGAQTSTPTSTNAQTSTPTSTGAQTSTPTSTNAQQPIHETKQNQQQRIGNGVSNGELTSGEAANLENKEHDLNQEENKMRALDNGHLTNSDRTALEQQQKQLSNQIYQDKHNAAEQNPDPQSREGRRAENQQERISSGIKNGELNPNEARQLESKESAINQEASADRAANGGKLTSAEKAQINRQQNHVSRQIYQQKHDARRR